MAERKSKHVERRTDISGSDMVYDFYCELCDDDDIKVEAEGFCVDCHEYLCKDCYTGHKRSRQSRHHELLDKDSMPKDTPLSTVRLSKDIATKCTLHSSRPVEFYCTQHDIFGCATCFLTTHNKCPNESISEKSENILDSKEYAEFIETLEAVKDKANDVISKTNKKADQLRRSFAEVEKSVRAFKQEIVSALENLEQDIIVEATELMSGEEEKLTSVLNTCEKVADTTETLLANLKSLHLSRRVCQVYISLKESRAQVKELKSDVRNVESTFKLQRFQFNVGLPLQDAVKQPKALVNIERFTKQNARLH